MTPAAACQIVVVGGINTDYLVRTTDLPQPQAPMVDGEFVSSCGGKGLNQAVAAGRLGATVALVGCVGGDPRGEDAILCLRTERIRTDFVKRASAASTGAAVVQVDANGRKQTSAALAANLRLTSDDVDRAAATIADARILLVQLEVPVDCVARAVTIAHMHRVPVIFDPAPARMLEDDLIQDLYVIKPNASEARTLTGVTVHDQNSARQAARQLRSRGARNAIVSTGEGTLLLEETSERWYPNLPVRTVDTTGSGDAFAAALAVALVEGQSLPAAVAFAHAAAAISTTIVGALPSLPSRDDLQRFIRQTELNQA